MNSGYKQQSQSTGRAFQYQFDLQIQKVKILRAIEIPPSSFMEVIWRRGQNNITTKKKSDVKGSEEDIEFNEKLSMISTCYLNTASDNKQFNPKQSIVSVIININGSQKLFGSLNINLSQVLNPANHRQTGIKFMEEELNGRTKSKIFLKLTSNYLKEMLKGDQQSVSSSNNYHNSSSYSIGFSHQNSQKKKQATSTNKLINQIPSKDAYSVVSYGGSGKYSCRRDDQPSSNNLIRRDDSNSKYDEKSITYGYYGNANGGINSFYNKAVNQYNLNRNTNALSVMNQTTNSAIRPSRNSDSEHNKSSMGEQNSRLLAEQQNKRSRLEAQNTKSRVQNSELKSKLTEYVRENMKLKEQLQKTKGNSQSEKTLKQQNQDLMNKNYSLAQQIRELKSKYDQISIIQKEYSALKKTKQSTDKQTAEQSNTITRLNQEIQQLHFALKQSKNNETNALRELRQIQNSSFNLENKFRKQIEEANQNFKKQLSKQQSNSYSLQSTLRQKDKIIASQKQELQKLEQAVNQNEQSQKNLAQDYRSKELELRELYEQYGSKIKQANSQSTQLQSLKKQVMTLQDERKRMNSELDSKSYKLKQELTLLQNKNQELLMKNNDLVNQKNSLLNQIRQDSLTSRRQSDKYRQIQSALNSQKIESQKEIHRLNGIIEKIQSENSELKRQNSDKARALEDINQNRMESDALMKLNFQIELQLKYKTQKLAALEHIQEQFSNLAMQKDITDKNYQQLHEAHERLEKELKQKNRAYILECEKNKIIAQDKINTSRGFTQMRQQLEQARQIITNGDKQVKQMDQYIYQLECRNNQLQRELKNSQANKANKDDLMKLQKERDKLQERVKELENRNNEKLLTLQNLNKSLAMSKNQIKELQLVSEERHHEIVNRDNYINELDTRIREIQKYANQVEEDLAREQQQKKSNIKKVQMLMEELFVYKKKLQEEKGRAHSSSYIRSSQDFMKIRNLQNQLQKREDKISKLQKQIINLEDQNVKLNIQIMKKLQALKQSGIVPKQG